MYNITKILKGLFTISWTLKPTILEHWPDDVDYIMSIDENGTPDLKGAVDAKNDLLQWFTITGVVFSKEDFLTAKTRMVDLKESFWEKGCYKNSRVVFHSRDIRKKTGPFNPKFINHNSFSNELSLLLSDLNYTIYSSSIDKFAHTRQYKNPFPVYNLCLEFVLERFCLFLKNQNKNGIILMESRGKSENQKLLNSAMSLLRDGNRFYDADQFDCVTGLYFNPKRTRNKKLSYILLEIADLVSYPLHKNARSNLKDSDFYSIERKIYNYPQYKGYGVKIFPRPYNVTIGGL